MKNNRLWRGAVLVLTLLPVAELLTAITLLPDTVAVHWGLDGTPDRYSSRFELLIPVAIILLVGAVFWFKGKGEHPKGFRAGGMGAMLLFNVIVPILLYVTFHPQVNLLRFSFGKIVCGLVAVVVLVVGNYLPKVSWEYRMKRYGFRTCYTLSDERVWERSQRFAGYCYTAAALVGILSALLLNDFACVLILVGAMLAANLAAYLYSYQIWKKLDREEKIRQK